MSKVNPEDHIGLVKTIAKGFKSRDSHALPTSDRVSVGYISLLKAVKNFDPSKGFAFTTYASRVIKSDISRYITVHGHRTFTRPYEPIQKCPSVDPDPNVCINIPSHEKNFEELTEEKDYIQSILSRCSKQEKAVLNGIFSGKMQKDIAATLGCKQANISRIYNNIITKEKQLLHERENQPR